MKDFYDLHWLQSHLNFNGATLIEAVSNTFARRGTEVPGEIPMAFTEQFYHNEQKLVQWNAFLRKGKLTLLPLDEVASDITQFLLPVIRKEVTDRQWTPTKNWQALNPHVNN